MNRLSKGALLPLMLLFSAFVWAQNKTVTGRVVDENGAVVGASVSVKNTTTGTTTNENGDFTLSVPATAQTLVISSVGYNSREVAI
ncbi:MAG TPA: carboxypeptidase-like regulatory domain-containing protein, partial [Flavisolibacter sp.]|nr:carboxypeptidase-like regulatory domain-containing protein [Flavisolibacter sp.]